ncbi:protein SIEVE ELEMENT OCCLUSION C [Carya illinoinensis]|uniref:Protein SIEVE ELEMENT OCCLUSION C n=1 Tax=Carya illinoinensis TaxID=32201 RepID=A0A8T1QKI7_CARIL|nr:protein SIEVE ELEMENT OCCLUSION C [Carya illinoinensis]KAG6654915.1 hypothetical protein CIPAW_05G178900 [Carya illinoinensis]
MNWLRNDPFSQSSSSFDEDIMIKKLHLTHEPDGRRLDSELLLRVTEHILLYAASTSEAPATPVVSDLHFDAIGKYNEDNAEAFGSQELLGQAIYKISSQILCKSCSGEDDLHTRTMFLFDFLGKYKWDAKMVLVLTAFATRYGKFWLLMQLDPRDPLAVSVGMLKQLPKDFSKLKPRFKALSLLIKTMVDVTKCVIKFEGLPLSHVDLDKEISITKACIPEAAYWVARSVFTCSSQISDFIAIQPEQVWYSDSTIIATWELSSLVFRLNRICSRLRRQVDLCHKQTETKIWQKLSNLFQQTPLDNQEVLSMLCALTDDLPLKYCPSQEKFGVSEMNNKVVMLLITKPELLPMEELLLLVQQTYDHPLNKNYKGSYEIIWFPITCSEAWTDAEVGNFNFFSNSLPWYTIRQPWLLSSAVVNYIKETWKYAGEPLMVVFDSKGIVTNLNAIDMVMIWGARAYPFSASREEELWKEEQWTLQLVIDHIDPQLAYWVEEGKNLCIYGSDGQEWIQEFNFKMRGIKSEGFQLEMVYVGKRNMDENVRNTLASIAEEKLNGSLSSTKVQFFWLRLERMRKSKLRLGKTANTDHILEEVSALLDFSDRGWAVMGKGSSTDTVKLQRKDPMQCSTLFSRGEKMTKMGFLDAIKSAFEPSPLPGYCSHTSVIPYAEGLIEETASCEKCKRPVKMFVVYE